MNSYSGAHLGVKGDGVRKEVAFGAPNVMDQAWEKISTPLRPSSVGFYDNSSGGHGLVDGQTPCWAFTNSAPGIKDQNGTLAPVNGGPW